MTCRFEFLSALMLFVASAAHAGHAGEMDTPGVMPHELMAGLVLLAGFLLLTILVLVWVVWRLSRLDQRLRALEEKRTGLGLC